MKFASAARPSADAARVASTFGGDSSDDESSSTTAGAAAAAAAAAATDSSSPATAAAAAASTAAAVVTEEQRHTIISTANWIANHPDQAEALRQNALELSSNGDSSSSDNSLAFLQDAAGATAQGKLYLEALAAAKARGEVQNSAVHVKDIACIVALLYSTISICSSASFVPVL
jgi:hypothetical protein